jgi:hypothetical protein
MPKPSPRSLTSQAKKTGKKESKKENVTQKANIYTATTTVIPSGHSQTPQMTGSQRRRQTRRTLQGRSPIATRGRTNESGNDDGKYTHEDNTNKLHTLYSTNTRHCTIRRRCERKIHTCYNTKNEMQYKQEDNTKNIHIHYNTKDDIQYKYKDITKKYTHTLQYRRRDTVQVRRKNTYNFRSKNEMQYEDTYVYFTMQRGDVI